MNKLWGIPLVAWGIAALAVAVIWLFVWPADKAAGVSGIQYLILRWGHALVWLLLAAAAFAAAFPGGERAAQMFGMLALATYVAFVYTTVTR